MSSRGDDVDEAAIWLIYAKTEKSIASMKFRLGYESPGVFARLPDSKDTVRTLKEAEAFLSKSAEEISQKKLIEAIETLRKARNNLRAYLIRKARLATREKGARTAKVGEPVP